VAYNKIDQAFTSEFIAGAFGLPIAHENMDYTPAQGTAYAEIKMIPNDVSKLTLNNSNETDGIFRIYLRYPSGTGAVTAKTMADTMLAYFPLGRRITYGTQDVTIMKASRKEGIQNNNWYELIITLSYWASI